MDYDGRVQWLQDGRVHMTTASRLATGPFDGWLLDARSGCQVAWRGLSFAGLEQRGRIPDSVWMATDGPLEHGELMRDA